MKKPKVHSSRFIYQGFFDVRQDFLEGNNGVKDHYTSLVLSSYGVVVLAQDEAGRWILNREYRHPTGGYLLGCPGGRLNEGEDPIEAGKRELLEETGYWVEELHLVGTSYPLPSVCNQRIHFLYGKGGVLKGKQALEAFEFIEPVLKTDVELRKEIREGTAVDTLLCAALWYKDHSKFN